MKFTPLFATVVALSTCAIAAPSKTPPKAKPKVTKPAAPSWKPATAAQRSAAAASIRAQLEAFKRDDWEKAATYQSDGLRRMFGTTARFRASIEGNYPQFANYASIGFDRAQALGVVVQITVRLKGKDGVQLRAIYTMIKEKGIYKVAGVQGGAAAAPEPGSATV